MLTELLPPSAAPAAPATRRLLRDDLDGREALAAYRQAGGYADTGWARTPAELIALVEESDLRGRGGAAYPASAKWRAVAAQPGPRVLLINAAESEPANRKGRTLLLTRPHLVLEGALLAARAVGAESCVLYVHDPALGRALELACYELAQAGARLPRWRTVVGPARYVAGEASAAIQFVNGGAAKPTTKPPRPHEAGCRRAANACPECRNARQCAADRARGRCVVPIGGLRGITGNHPAHPQRWRAPARRLRSADRGGAPSGIPRVRRRYTGGVAGGIAGRLLRGLAFRRRRRERCRAHAGESARGRHGPRLGGDHGRS